LSSVRILAIIFAVIVIVPGCTHLQESGVKRYRTTEKSSIDGNPAKAHHEQAIALMDQGRYDEAEQALQEALLADIDFGPAHNTLGKLYYNQQKFYLASWEFEHATKAMPGRPEPLNNLGLIYESIERPEMAISYYQNAVELDPNNPEYLGNLIRARIRFDDKSYDLVQQLEHLIFIDDRSNWIDWAKLQLIKAQDDRVGRINDSDDAQPMPVVTIIEEQQVEQDYDNSSGDYFAPQPSSAPQPSAIEAVPNVPFENVPFENVPFENVPFEDVPFEDVPFEDVPSLAVNVEQVCKIALPIVALKCRATIETLVDPLRAVFQPACPTVGLRYRFGFSGDS